jgi:hypothetical protein
MFPKCGNRLIDYLMIIEITFFIVLWNLIVNANDDIRLYLMFGYWKQKSIKICNPISRKI